VSGFDPLHGLTDEQASRCAIELEKNPLWNAMLIELDNRAVDTWRHSGGQPQREAAWHSMVAVQALRHQITGWIDNVKIEAASRAAKRRSDAA
jgi:hypothetical protein